MTIWTWSVVLFAAAAVGGVTMLAMRMRERGVPMALALGHGALAATGLVLLVLAVLSGGGGTLATVALVVFVVAALGGFALFATHLRSGTFPLGLAWVHGGAAVVAFLLLLFGIYG